VVKSNVKDVVADGFASAAGLCPADRIAQCRDAGIR
jgi:hypothetical protein